MKTHVLTGLLMVVLGIALYVSWQYDATTRDTASTDFSVATTSSATFGSDVVTLRGTYTCLPLLDGSVSATDCAFGIQTEDGRYYAVNFGAGAGSMADFKDGAQITAKGTIIESANLNPNSWSKFQSEGLFTILERP